jgi:hypothetical protein
MALGNGFDRLKYSQKCSDFGGWEHLTRLFVVVRYLFLFGLFFSFAFAASVVPLSVGAPAVCVSDGLRTDVVGFEFLMKVIPVPLATLGNSTYLPSNVTFSALNSSELPLLFFFSGNVVPASGPPGSLVSLSGRFASGGEIVVYFDVANVTAVVSQKLGFWSASFVVPCVSVGVHTVRAIDLRGGWMTTASFYVTSTDAGFSIPSLVLFGFFAMATLSGSVALVLLIGFRDRDGRE